MFELDFDCLSRVIVASKVNDEQPLGPRPDDRAVQLMRRMAKIIAPAEDLGILLYSRARPDVCALIKSTRPLCLKGQPVSSAKRRAFSIEDL